MNVNKKERNMYYIGKCSLKIYVVFDLCVTKNDFQLEQQRWSSKKGIQGKCTRNLH